MPFLQLLSGMLKNIIRRLSDTVLAVANADYYHSIKDIKEVGLVAL